MKKILLFITYFLAVVFSTQAQTLYSSTPGGGDYGGGAIIKFVPSTNKLTTGKSFESEGYAPVAGFLQAKDGKLYGMTTYGGKFHNGVIFSFDPSTSAYRRLKDFDESNGGFPGGALIQAKDGKLYGMTAAGGSHGYGVIFSFDPASSAYMKLKDFDGTNGASPHGNLIQASDGKLYGMTYQGGIYGREEENGGYGVIFSFDPATSSYTKLMDFDGDNGAYPGGSFIQAKNGKLYGMAGSGGIAGDGVIFSFDPLVSTYIKLKDLDNFQDKTGRNASGSLIQATNGKLYGTTYWGGINDNGVMFSFDPSSSSYTKLKEFDGANGKYPQANLVQASNGKLYGVTISGGSSNNGVIFSYDPLTSTYAKQKDFDGTKGNPRGSLIQASNGKLYGTATKPAFRIDEVAGVIFSFDPSAFIYTNLKDFGTNQDGKGVSGNLLQARDGKLYGATFSGGSSNAGVIFSFDPSTLTYKKLKDFDNVNGSYPLGSLIQSSDGKLYGLTKAGGINGKGIIFSFDASSLAYKKLHDFDDTTPGAPNGGLVKASNGRLYGIRQSEGIGGYGVIFSFDPSSSSYTEFAGYVAHGSLILASNGKLYGMVTGEDGYIFSFDPLSSTYTVLKQLSYPFGSLMQASNGKLYGMLRDDYFPESTLFENTFFSFNPFTSSYKIEKVFDLHKEGYPNGSLMQARDGKLYGMTSDTIFSFDPSSSVYKQLKAHNGDNGTVGSGPAFTEIREQPPIVNLTSPVNNAVYSTRVTGPVIPLIATVSEPYAPTTSVQFFRGSTLLKTDSSSPYSFTVNNLPPGNYTFVAKATDINGLTSTSATVAVSVVDSVNKAPLVSISDPVTNSTFISPAVITIKATASDPDGTIRNVKLFNGSTLLGTDSIAPYSYTINNSPAGIYKLYAQATDNNGLKTSSSTVTAFVVPGTANKAPAVSITTPANNKNYPGITTLVVNASASDTDGNISNVKFYEGSVLLNTDSTSPYSCSISNPTTGNHSFVARAMDNMGLVSNSASVTVSVGPLVNKSPGIKITAPVNNTVSIAGSTITINATASDPDGTISKVEFFNGSTLLGTDNTMPFSNTLNNVVAGTCKLYARATDNKGLASLSSSVYLFVVPGTSNKAPFIQLTSPANNSFNSTPGTIFLRADASDIDGTISNVKFYNGSTLVATDSIAPYNDTLTNVPPGNYSLIARATDNKGLQSNSANAAVSVIILPNKAPVVNFTSPLNNSSYAAPASITLTASASDEDGTITNVKFYDGTALLATVSKSPYKFTMNNVPAGTHKFYAKATDNNGLTNSTATLYVVVTAAAQTNLHVTTVNQSKTGRMFSTGTTESALMDQKKLRVTPNPAHSIVNIFITGLSANKKQIISILSASGVVIRTIHTSSSGRPIQLNVSSLASGMYTIKMINGDKVMYSKFVKM